MVSIQIEQIHPALTWRIRQEAMYPDKTLNDVKLEHDHDGIHFGLYAGDQLTSVVSLFEAGDTCQFRKFATLPESQGKGYGGLLLVHIINYNRKNGIKKLYCNARISATAFYTKYGFRQTNKTWTDKGFDFVIMELAL